MSYQYEDELPPEARQRYVTKLNIAGLEMCPFKLPADTWINDPKKWPDVEYDDVYAYLIKSPRLYSQEAMENYRSLEAHTFFVSGWVQTIHHVKTTSGNFVFKADVKPSWRVTEEPHHPWVTVKKTGPVINAHCDCMAGLGETCSHIGALLFKIEAALRLGYTASACTDVPCAWNECFVKNVDPAEISNIKFYKTEPKDKLKESARNVKTTPEPATETEQQEFLRSLASLDENCIGLSMFNEYTDRFVSLGPLPSARKLPQSFRSLHLSDYEKMDDTELIDVCDSIYEKLHVSEAEALYLEEVTRLQSSSSVWLEQRVGRITASIVGDCLKTNQMSSAPSIVKKICIPQTTPLRVAAVEWGNKHEEDAFRMYTNLYTNSGPAPNTVPTGEIITAVTYGHTDASVRKAGLTISTEFPFLGASPAGVVKCQCCGMGVLEIKCPFKYKDIPLKNAFSEPKFCIDTNYTLKKTHKYYAQVQLQMLVSQTSFADLFTWTPIDCALVRVRKDENFITEMTSTLPPLWKSHILPELLTRRMENFRKSECQEDKENEATGSHEKHCVCQTTTDLDNMVGCDRCDQWYHPQCLGLKQLPKTKTWYCKECRKNM